MVKEKKVPLRKCSGCLEMKEKKQLLRVVKSEGNEFSIDITGKMPGRGAYICKNAACFQKARKSKGFERSFKMSVPKEIYERLEKEIMKITEISE